MFYILKRIFFDTLKIGMRYIRGRALATGNFSHEARLNKKKKMKKNLIKSVFAQLRTRPRSNSLTAFRVLHAQITIEAQARGWSSKWNMSCSRASKSALSVVFVFVFVFVFGIHFASKGLQQLCHVIGLLICLQMASSFYGEIRK